MITTWKDGEDLQVGKLVNCNGTYVIVVGFSEEEVALVSPFNPQQFQQRVPIGMVFRPRIEPWADQMSSFINSTRDFSALFLKADEEEVKPEDEVDTSGEEEVAEE